jgi:antirestriction protein ArdC/phage/plasmid primase-like uncharacterized protein
MAMNEITKPFVEAVAEKLIEQLKEGVAPWQKPWQPGEPGSAMPFNPVTGNRYKGINALQLMSEDRADQRWMTYKQAASVGAQVRKGEKGTPIQYWKFTEEQPLTDANDKPVLDADGKPVKHTVKLERPALFCATVFNAEQIDGLAPQQPRKDQSWAPQERAEAILNASGASIQHSEHDKAFYRLSTDTIHLPAKEQFETADRYYATALHELGHWTGHPSRLDRDLAHPFGSEGYAREELRAEIASMMIGDELGVGHDPGQHAAYVGSWIKAIRDDPLEIFRAAVDAEKIQAHVLGMENKQQLENAEAQQVASYIAANQGLSPEVVANNAMTAEPELKAILADEAKMKALDARVSALLQGINRSYIDEVRATVASTSPDEGASESVAEESVRAVYPAVPDADLDDAQMVAEFIEANINAGRESIESNVASASPALKAILADSRRMTSIESQVDQLLHNLNRAQIDETRAVSAATLRHGSTQAAARIAGSDAHSEENEFEKAVKLAKIREEAVCEDPNSTEEDIAAAREATKDAELHAARNDADRGRRLAEQEQARAAGQAGATPAGNKADTPDGAGREYLAVPYAERKAAKAAGAAWDKDARSWYAGAGADMAALARWRPDSGVPQQMPGMTPREEFAEVLRSVGCVVAGVHPIMDGQKHRISVVGEKQPGNGGSGFYVGHLDGHPAGYARNNKTGVEVRWKSKGYKLDQGQKVLLTALVAGKLQERSAEQGRLQEQAAERVTLQLADLVPVTRLTPYMQAKGLEPMPGAFTDKVGNTTYVPGIDADGKQWTTQYIQEDGTKRFARDSRVAGCFHAVGGPDALAKAPALVIAQEYATASSLASSLGHSTVAAFDAGNLPAVAAALHKKFPDKPVVIAGNNDQLQAASSGRVRCTKAKEAARVSGGRLLTPIFAPGEVDASPQEFTDFNDLANRSKLGREGLDRQVRPIVAAEIEKHQAAAERLTQGQSLQQRHALKIG